ncbi:MAG: FAD-dependent thymidylate synthase [Firmicutes bacterium]|nr:FAD-dependent thymidylate synthase [Bacillota bacterium]MCL1953615.1 FAD-dependent thymidylate synthase [Bacillota bacterium]
MEDFYKNQGDTKSRQVSGIARLIRYTPNPEETVAFAAKLCYSSLDTDNLIQKIESRDNAKFIKALFEMGHLSPFEHASFVFSIEGVSRSLLAQISRHRIASFSVRSQRYVSEDEFGFVMPPSIASLGDDAIAEYKSQMDTMMGWYQQWQQKLGGKSEHANEDARFVLPNACETKMIMTMNARELLHFFEVRGCERAQWEIRDIAWQMMSQTLAVAPNIFAKSGPGCTFGHCTEGKFNCGKAKEIRQKRKDLTTKVMSNKLIPEIVDGLSVDDSQERELMSV